MLASLNILCSTCCCNSDCGCYCDCCSKVSSLNISLTLSSGLSLHQVLEKCSLYTCDQVQRDNMRKTQPAMVDASVGTSKGDSSAHFSVSQVDLCHSCNCLVGLLSSHIAHASCLQSTPSLLVTCVQLWGQCIQCMWCYLCGVLLVCSLSTAC